MRSFILLVVLLCLFVCLQQSQAEDWENFLGPRHNGTSDEKGILTDWSDEKLELLWSRELGSSYGIGSVSQNRYFQFDRVGDSESLICLDATTGKEHWHTDQPVDYQDMYGYNNGPRSSPVIQENFVITYGVSGNLTCTHIEDGKAKWKKNLSDDYQVIQNFFGVACSPVVYKDFVIVIVGGSPDEARQVPLGQLDRVAPNGTAIVAFNISDGKEAYRVGNDLASYSTPLIHTVDSTVMGFAFARDGLLAFAPETGRQYWHFPWRSPRLESVNAALPVVRGNQVLISECYDIGSALLSVSPSGSKLLRKDPRPRRDQSFRAHWATPIYHDGYVFGCSGRNEPDSDLRCIRWSDGKVMWQEDNRIRTSLLYVDDHFVVLDERGRLELIKAVSDSYTPVTSLDLSKPLANSRGSFFEPPCWAAPILANGLLYVRGSNRVACFRLIPES